MNTKEIPLLRCERNGSQHRVQIVVDDKDLPYYFEAAELFPNLGVRVTIINRPGEEYQTTEGLFLRLRDNSFYIGIENMENFDLGPFYKTVKNLKQLDVTK